MTSPAEAIRLAKAIERYTKFDAKFGRKIWLCNTGPCFCVKTIALVESIAETFHRFREHLGLTDALEQVGDDTREQISALVAALQIRGRESYLAEA